jgi:LysR family transcriptional regulator, regulator for bpeEF and oprC
MLRETGLAFHNGIMIPKSTIDQLALTDLRLFSKATQMSGLAIAGRALGIPRASATRQLQRLEAAVGCRLIHRDARRFVLTEDGRAFLPLVVRALADLDEAMDMVRGKKGQLRGALRIAAPYTYGQTVLAPLLAGFARLHPDLVVSVELGSRHIDLFGNEADLAIRIGPTGSDDLIARRLGSEALILIAAADYVRATAPFERVADLAQHRMLDYKLNTPTRDLELTDGIGREVVRISPCFTSNEPGMLIAAARDGLGVAIVAQSLAAESLKDGAVVRVLSRWRSTSLDINALYVPGRGQSPKIRAFLDYATNELA